MKKLVFSTSLLLMLFSCGNRQSSTQPIVEEQPKSVQIQDTLENVLTTPTDDSVAVKKKNKRRRQEAPKHNSPDQEAIDSIKAAKAKLKNS